MNPASRLLLCFSAAMILCQCSSTEKKKVDPAHMTLAQRSMLKPDESQRSSFEKYLTDPKLNKNSGGSFFQKQKHHSKSFSGASSYAGQKQFKTIQSIFGKSKAQGLDMTYALGDRRAGGAKSSFKTATSRFGSQQAHESKSLFDVNTFKTGSALTHRRSTGKAPKIIENYNDRGNGKKSAYSEDEVRKLLNRN